MSRIKIPPPNDPSITGQVACNPREPWPASVLKAAGAIPDFPSLNEIRNGHVRTRAGRVLQHRRIVTQ